MLRHENSTPSSGIELGRVGVTVERDGYDTFYTGTRDAMITAGLVTAEQTPGDPACPNTKVFRFIRAGRSHTVSVSKKAALVKLYVGPTPEELDAYWARVAAENEARHVAVSVHKEIESLPRSREAYERIVGALTSVRCARDQLLRPIGGYSVTEAAWNEFEQAVDMALDELLEHVVFSRAARDREIAAWRQKAAEADPDFARFMGAVTQKPARY